MMITIFSPPFRLFHAAAIAAAAAMIFLPLSLYAAASLRCRLRYAALQRECGDMIYACC